ncbi:hypothetical protein [Hyphomicrobium sp. D-2]|uniref:hypothetical protein n=1 Tax=Hyphomicrobium sp. D-2 TaxID=3041621 RepID=UPI002458A5E9|nr:hypothetical protein [Hyphomicrobium sp. D-2]MDH4981875.1 hypothetical protein [Hyphomicrobium sp. D-2]
MDLRGDALNAKSLLVGFGESPYASTSNGGWSETPFQRWIKFKEAYSQRFVRDALALSKFTPTHCIDPFGGSGTTSLVCSQQGIRSTSIEVNPFLADVISAKTNPSDRKTLLRNFERVRATLSQVQLQPLDRTFREAPKTLFEPGLNGRFIYTKAVGVRILTYLAAIEQLRDGKAKRTLKVLLGGILVSVSNIVVNGKGRRYRSNWQARSTTAVDVDRLFEAAVMQCAADLDEIANSALSPTTLLRGDCRSLIHKCSIGDISIFSPPYPNSFDYTDVYNLELWTLGYLKSRNQNLSLRRATLRSHVQATFEYSRVTRTPQLTKTLKKLERAREHLWDRRIPEMVQGYFDDLHLVLSGLTRRLARRSLIVMAVGDSRYAGINVRTAEVLGEMAETMGLHVVSADRIRQIRASAQHGGDRELAETRVVLRT